MKCNIYDILKLWLAISEVGWGARDRYRKKEDEEDKEEMKKEKEKKVR